MIGKSAFAALAGLMILASPAIAQQQDLPEQITEGIQKLSHPRFTVRDRASRDLIQIGEPALKSLKAAAMSKDEEVRRRAESIVRVIEARLLNAALLKAPTLRLKYEGKPLDEAIADLKQKTGLPFVLDLKSGKNPKQPITLDTGDVPYWEAVEKFLAVARLGELDEAKSAAPVLNQEVIGRGRMVYRQGVPAVPEKKFHLVESTSPVDAATSTIIRVKALPKGGPGATITKGSNEIQFMLDVTPAPSLTWQGLVNVEVRKAVDERGTSLAQSHLTNGPPMPAEFGEFDGIQIINGGGQIIVQGQAQIFIGNDWSGPAPAMGNPRHIPVTLIGKEAGTKSLKQIEGIITARVLAPAEQLLAIDNLQTAPLKEWISAGDHRVQITERTNRNGAVQLRIRIEAPVQTQVDVPFQGRRRGFQVETGPLANGHTTIGFQDADGKPLTNVMMNLIEQLGDETRQTSDYVVTLTKMPKTTDAVKFVLTGRRSVCVEVPFVLKNVQLP